MERRLSDNAVREPNVRDQPRDIRFVPGIESPRPLRNGEWEPGIVSGGAQLTASRAGDFGPCLYFGPRGERCTRPALEGGFCARHAHSSQKTTGEPEEESGIAPVLTPKRLGALIAAAAALWPFVADVVKEILRHLR